jgi:Bacterial aa3 type cytochrome c oxidase subunit IV
MAATTMDPLFAEHYRTWLGFTRLIRYVLAGLIILLILMAIFLL